MTTPLTEEQVAQIKTMAMLLGAHCNDEDHHKEIGQNKYDDLMKNKKENGWKGWYDFKEKDIAENMKNIAIEQGASARMRRIEGEHTVFINW